MPKGTALPKRRNKSIKVEYWMGFLQNIEVRRCSINKGPRGVTVKTRILQKT